MPAKGAALDPAFDSRFIQVLENIERQFDAGAVAVEFEDAVGRRGFSAASGQGGKKTPTYNEQTP